MLATELAARTGPAPRRLSIPWLRPKIDHKEPRCDRSFEAYTRLDSRPFTGWKLNPYTEGSYTLADSVIERGFSEDGESLSGNLVPEAPREVAYLTAGVEHSAGWNASVSWIYRGAFFTDEENTPFGGDPEGEDGEVPEVWLN